MGRKSGSCIAAAFNTRAALCAAQSRCNAGSSAWPIDAWPPSLWVQAGGFVRDNRINGALNVSRTIGDLDFKRNAELPHTEQMVRTTSQTAASTLNS